MEKFISWKQNTCSVWTKLRSIPYPYGKAFFVRSCTYLSLNLLQALALHFIMLKWELGLFGCLAPNSRDTTRSKKLHYIEKVLTSSSVRWLLSTTLWGKLDSRSWSQPSSGKLKFSPVWNSIISISSFILPSSLLRTDIFVTFQT